MAQDAPATTAPGWSELMQRLGGTPDAVLEAQLYAALRALPRALPDAALRADVEALRSFPVISSETHIERIERQVPRYPVAAAARALLRRWDTEAAIAALGDDTARAMRATPAVTARWLARQSVSGCRRALDEIAATPPALSDDRVLVALNRCADGPRTRALLRERGAGPVAMRRLAELAAALNDAEAAALWLATLDNPALASPALHALREYAATVPAARVAIERRLEDPQLGRDAAIALGRSGIGTAQLESALQSAQGVRQRRLLLALQARGDAGARAALRRFSLDSQAEPALREEVAAWLR